MKTKIIMTALLCMCMLFSLTAIADCVKSDERAGCFYTESAECDAELFAASDNLPSLATPKNLKWNIDEYGDEANGFVSWDAVENCEGKYKITLYCGSEQVWYTHWSGLYDHDGNGRLDVDIFSRNQFSKSGTYYFTIMAFGDEVKYGDSAIAKSAAYKFTCPSARIATPTLLEWVEFGVLRHKASANAWGYVYEIFNQDMISIGSTWGPVFEDEIEGGYKTKDLTWYFEDIAGWEEDFELAYVKVTALTPDIETYMNSHASAYSPVLKIEANTICGKNELDKALDKLYSGEASASDALEDFKDSLADNDITSSALAVSMQQDEELVDNIALLEDEYKNETGVETEIVDNSGDYLDEKGIDISDIQMVGAALNSEDGNDVSLVFDTPDASISLDPLFYKNAVGVGIDMEGVSDNQSLEIPVQIIMPIPENVLPERLIIVHCHKDGSMETIHPAIEKSSGKYYARFVLTSFSTFVFCNEAVKTGDLNCDDEVDMNDAILLLQHSMFSELYPVEYPGSIDFTGDDEIDMNDAILLLQYSMFPDLYPIE